MDAGIQDTVKMVSVPVSKGKIMIRLQNLADSFDADTSPKQVNKTMIIEELWKSVNTKDAFMKPYIVTETSITGNQDIDTMNDKRL